MSRQLPINKANTAHNSRNSAAARLSFGTVSLVSTETSDHSAVHQSPSSISVALSVGSDVEADVPEMLDPKKIYKAYRDLQKQVIELQEENKKLKASNLDLNLSATTLRRTRTSKKAVAIQSAKSGNATENVSDDSIHHLDLVRKIMKLGQHHQLFWCVILDVSQFSRENCPEWDWNDFQVRYSSAQLQKQGPTAELFAAIPAEYHDLMALSTSSESGKNFVRHFRGAMGQSRSNSLAALRSYSNLIFAEYGLCANVFESKYDREQVADIRKLLGCTLDPATNTFKYARFPPIICKGDNAEIVGKRFLNPVLFRVARAVIFGKAAIKSKAAAVARSSSMYLRPDKYPQTTVGLVAWVAMMTRFILSKDTTFDQTGVGNLTKVSYYSDYDFYKRWILQAKAQSPVWATSLFVTWDTEIFSQHNKTTSRTPDDEGETISLDDADEIAHDMDVLDLNDVLESSLDDGMDINAHAGNDAEASLDPLASVGQAQATRPPTLHRTETTLEEVLLDEGEMTPKALNPDDFAFDDIYDLVNDPGAAENGTRSNTNQRTETSDDIAMTTPVTRATRSKANLISQLEEQAQPAQGPKVPKPPRVRRNNKKT